MSNPLRDTSELGKNLNRLDASYEVNSLINPNVGYEDIGYDISYNYGSNIDRINQNNQSSRSAIGNAIGQAASEILSLIHI